MVVLAATLNHRLLFLGNDETFGNHVVSPTDSWLLSILILRHSIQSGTEAGTSDDALSSDKYNKARLWYGLLRWNSI